MRSLHGESLLFLRKRKVDVWLAAGLLTSQISDAFPARGASDSEPVTNGLSCLKLKTVRAVFHGLQLREQLRIYTGFPFHPLRGQQNRKRGKGRKYIALDPVLTSEMVEFVWSLEILSFKNVEKGS